MKGKTSILSSRSWASLPAELLNVIMTELILATTRNCLPRTWIAEAGGARHWQNALVYRALRDMTCPDAMMNVCSGWNAALAYHPIWSHLISIVDPMDIGAPSGIITNSHASHGSSTTATKLKLTPYAHLIQLLNASCLICRINHPSSSHGVLNGRKPNIYSSSGSGGGVINSSTYGVYDEGIIPVCKYHRQDDSYCSICLREVPQQAYGGHAGEFYDHYLFTLGVYSNEDTFAFPSARATCRNCRITYLTVLAKRHAALHVTGGAWLLHQPALDWESKNAIDGFVDTGEGTAEAVLRVCKEKWWMRSNTKLGEFVRLGVRSERLALIGAGDREEDWEEEMLSDDEEEDPTELSIIEEQGARELAIHDWIRNQVIRGDWRDPIDVWFDAASLARHQVSVSDRRIVDTYRMITRDGIDILRFDADFEYESDFESEAGDMDDGEGWLEGEERPSVPFDVEEPHTIEVKRPCWWSFIEDEDTAPNEGSAPSAPSEQSSRSAREDDDRDESLSIASSQVNPEVLGDDMDEETLKLVLELSRQDQEEIAQLQRNRESAPSPPPALDRRGVNGHTRPPRTMRSSGNSSSYTKPAAFSLSPTAIADGTATVPLMPPLDYHHPPTHHLASIFSCYQAAVMKEVLGVAMERIVRAVERVASRTATIIEQGMLDDPAPGEENGGKRKIDGGYLATKLSLEDVVRLLRDVDECWVIPSSGASSTSSPLLTRASLPGSVEIEEEEWNRVEQEVEKTLAKWLPEAALSHPEAGFEDTISEGPVVSAGSKLIHPIPWIPVDLSTLGRRGFAILGQVWRQACSPLYHCKCSICERARRVERDTATRKQAQLLEIEAQRREAEKRSKEEEELYEESLRERFGVMDQRPPPPQMQTPTRPVQPLPPGQNIVVPQAPMPPPSAERQTDWNSYPQTTTQPLKSVQQINMEINQAQHRDASGGGGGTNMYPPLPQAGTIVIPPATNLSPPLPARQTNADDEKEPERQRKRSRDDVETPSATDESPPRTTSTPLSASSEDGERECKRLRDYEVGVKGNMVLVEDFAGEDGAGKKRQSEELLEENGIGAGVEILGKRVRVE